MWQIVYTQNSIYADSTELQYMQNSVYANRWFGFRQRSHSVSSSNFLITALITNGFCQCRLYDPQFSLCDGQKGHLIPLSLKDVGWIHSLCPMYTQNSKIKQKNKKSRKFLMEGFIFWNTKWVCVPEENSGSSSLGYLLWPKHTYIWHMILADLGDSAD